MEFSISDELKVLRVRVRDFVEKEIIPLERREDCIDEYRNIAPHALERVREQVKRAGMWAPQMPQRYGGLGLNRRTVTTISFGISPFWPSAPSRCRSIHA